jgi:hypothetical protein
LILRCASYNSMVAMDRIELKNGVVVEVDDKTCMLSGDLYMIHLEFSTVVRLEEKDSELRQYCGGEQLKKTRVFKRPAVNKRDLEEVKKTMKESFLQSTTPYMERPKFIKRFKQMCLEELRDQEEKMRWATSYEE